MLGTSAGTMLGTVGDGRFDVEVWRVAQRIIATRQSHLHIFLEPVLPMPPAEGNNTGRLTGGRP
jgi:hypothetical protein